VVVGGYLFRGRGLTLYLQIIQGAKMSLFTYGLAVLFLCMEQLFVLEMEAIGGKYLRLGGYWPPSQHPRAATA